MVIVNPANPGSESGVRRGPVFGEIQRFALLVGWNNIFTPLKRLFDLPP